jgi:eukaryotic-like serine/threonine-protein kinase
MRSSTYVTERVLGRGGMSTVYLARDERTGERVALKVLAGHLADDEEYRARFLREGRVARRVTHPNVVRVFDVGEDERGLYIVMEHVSGPTLASELARRGPFSANRAVEVGLQVSSALEAVHAAGLVHRDVTPHNILLGPGGIVKLSDFGIARLLDGTRLTEHGTVVGTAAYLAPEQARGEQVTPAADIYSLGIVLYELLTGHPPFRAETLPALLLQRERGELVPPSKLADVPLEVEAVVLHCVDRDPDSRPTAAALGAALSASAATDVLPEQAGDAETRVLAGAETQQHTDRTTRLLQTVRSSSSRRRSAVLLAAVAAAVLAAVGLSGGMLGASGNRDAGAAPPWIHMAASSASQSTTAPSAPPPAPVATPTALPACASLAARRAALEQQREATDEAGDGHGRGVGRGKGKHKGQEKQVERQRLAIDEQIHEIEDQQKDCG